jgi:signal transduction histidine kinase
MRHYTTKSSLQKLNKYNNIKDMRNLTLSMKFIIGCSLTLIIALGISFYALAQRQERLIIGQVENEARVLFKQIVLTRKWIADHGGIFVEKFPWTKASPYLRNPEVVDAAGKRYILQTPAMVTKELSKYAKDKELYWFHITSLKLTNPENAPDEFETKALRRFEDKNLKELISIETIDNAKYLRYISPLYVEDVCLRCHAYQGYQVGDIRGAISITIPVDKTLAEMSANKKGMLAAGILTTASLIAALFMMMKRLVLTPMKKLKSSINEFSEGRYSPEKRLQTGDEFEELCRAFSNMAGTLTEYHNCLNDKIHTATKDLEDTNKKLTDANRLLSESNIRKSDFIARASHELRTPLTSIKGAMDYISARLSSLPPQKAAPNMEKTTIDDLQIFLDVIKKNSERLIRIVNDMLDLERIEMGASELHFNYTNISYLIAETITYFQANAEEIGITFNANIPDNMQVYADEDRLRQVLVNLLGNAIKFSHSGSEIIVFAYPERNFVVVEIWDDGPGIPLSIQEKVFDKFYKSGKKEGSGLGLAICKSIIEAHNGIIGVNSDGKDGTCFYFKLPHSFKADLTYDAYTEHAMQKKLLDIVKNNKKIAVATEINT